MALYSFDGRTWAIDLKGLTEFEERVAGKKLEARRMIKESQLDRI